MKNSIKCLAVILFISAELIGTIFATAMAQAWINMDLTQADCLARAESALRKREFTQQLEVTDETAFGDKGAYAVGLRCVESKKMLILTVAGPEAPEAGKFLEEIHDEIRKIF